MDAKYVWAPHDELSWHPCRSKGPAVGPKVTLIDDNGNETQIDTDEFKKMEPCDHAALEDNVSNLITLSNFSEGVILHHLRKRYMKDEIYTKIGSILMSINPYKMLPIYKQTTRASYEHKILPPEIAPHIFETASRTHSALLADRRNQSVIISGESGAGKTEATKLILHYISEVAGSPEGTEQLILESNPILEAFGNAKTQRNDNSSRFGKWMVVHFSAQQYICGAQIVNYLLEKSRIVRQAQSERNYHIFYQLADGAKDKMRKNLRMRAATEFNYLTKGNTTKVDRVDDRAEFESTLAAMKKLGFSQSDIDAAFQIVAGVMHLGNIDFDTKGDDACAVMADSMRAVDDAAAVLGLPKDKLQQLMENKAMTVVGETVVSPQSKKAALFCRDALSKALYGTMFDWLVRTVNKAMAWTEKNTMTIGCLDIFGFEIFEENLFEQFCINYANEKLQQHFNNHIFKMEQDEYSSEGIDVSHVDFVDNSDTLAMIERRSDGILAMCNEEVSVPKGSDENLIQKMHAQFSRKEKHPRYKKGSPKTPQIFVIYHYAGPVEYDSTGFLSRNRDSLMASLIQMLQGSTVPAITDLFTPKEDPNAAAAPRGRSRRGKSNKRTLLQQFQSSLTTLYDTLGKTEPHFVRCIKPNSVKQYRNFTSDMILRQLRYSGLFEAIRIRKAGFSHRKEHDRFAATYNPLLPKEARLASRALPAEDKCQLVIDHLKESIDVRDIQIGKTKVFYRGKVPNQLDMAVEHALGGIVLLLQSVVRGFLQRLKFKVILQVVDKIKDAIKQRSLSAIEQVLALCDSKNVENHMVDRAEKLYRRLQDEKRIGQQFDKALTQNAADGIDFAVLEAALEAAKKANIDETCEDKSVVDKIAQASAAVEKIKKNIALKKHLEKAIKSKSASKLAEAITDAEANGVALHADLLNEAKELMSRVENESKLVTALATACTKAQEFTFSDSNSYDAPIQLLVAALNDVEGLELVNANHQKSIELADDLMRGFKKKKAEVKAQEVATAAREAEEREKERLRLEAQEKKRQAEDEVRLQKMLANKKKASEAAALKEKIEKERFEADRKATEAAAAKATADEELAKQQEQVQQEKAQLVEEDKAKKQQRQQEAATKKKAKDVAAKQKSEAAEQERRKKANVNNSEAETILQQQKAAEKLHAKMAKIADTYALDRVFCLRRPANYAMFVVFNREQIKNSMYHWQKEEIPRSLVKFTNEYCGKERKSALSSEAKELFKNILCYMRDRFHPYPAVMGHEVVTRGHEEPFLRDEIYAQLIKQTTECENSQSAVFGWKLMYMCLMTFKPSDDMSEALISHIASHADPRMPVGFESIGSAAARCYYMWDIVRESAPRPSPPTLEEFGIFTVGTEQDIGLNIVDVKVPSAVVVEGVVFYVVGVQSDDDKWLVTKRFSQFDELDKMLKSYHHETENLPTLPPKKIKMFSSHLSPAFIEERRVNLENFVQALLGHDNDSIKSSREFKEFLKKPEQHNDPDSYETDTDSDEWTDAESEYESDQDDENQTEIQQALKRMMERDAEEAAHEAQEKQKEQQAQHAGTGQGIGVNEDKSPPTNAPPSGRPSVATASKEITPVPEEDEIDESLAALFDEKAGTFPLSSVRGIRDADDFAHHSVFNKKAIKDFMYVFQLDETPRSMMKLNTQYLKFHHCKTEKKKQINKQALEFFKAIQIYMGDREHEDPTLVGHELVLQAWNEPVLQDELFCQLIKQTTDCPDEERAIYGWKLLFTLLLAIPPSDEISLALFSHFSKYARPTNHPQGFDTVADAAVRCYHAWSKLKSDIPRPFVPSFEEFRACTDGRKMEVKVYTEEQVFIRIAIPVIDRLITVGEIADKITAELKLDSPHHICVLQNIMTNDAQAPERVIRDIRPTETVLNIMAQMEHETRDHPDELRFNLKFKAKDADLR